MAEQDIDARIGEAWKAHYEGKEDVAIEHFRRIVDEAPDNIDALWGLGLSYRDAGDKASAVEAFNRVKVMVSAMLDNETGELGRYFMLNRMVHQQLEQMEEFRRK